MAGVRSKDHGEKRQRILDESANLFAAQGFNKTSIAEISSACNASKAWIYHYFPNKEDILFTLLRNFLVELQERLAKASCAEQADGDPVARLRSFVRECLQIYDDYRINYPILFNEMRYLPEEQQAELKEIEKKTVADLENILVAIRPEMANVASHRRPLTLLVFGTINWTYTWFEPEGKISADDLTEMSVRLIVAGLRDPKILDQGK
jgi:AcrR family transcriptional regulator